MLGAADPQRPHKKGRFTMERLVILVQEVQELFSKVDEYVNQCRARGLVCPPGCRECCETASFNIEVSPIEFLPLALWWRNLGLLEMWHEKVRKNLERCPLFVANPSIKPEGGCLFYEFRPLTCRLFGMAKVKVKSGYQWLGCKILAGLVRQPLLDTEALADANTFRMMVVGIEPSLSRLFPISEALGKAIEYVGLYDKICQLGHRFWSKPRKAA